MKKKISAYWWCQLALWNISILVSTIFYFTLPAFTTFSFYPAVFLHVTIGIFFTHLMRLFIIKAKLLELNVFKKIIYLLPVTFLVTTLNSVISVSLNRIFKWENPSFGAHSFGTETMVISFSNFPFFGIWNLVYFIYHYIEKSHRQQIDKIRLENELKMQQLESEKKETALKQQATELEMQALRAQMNPHFIFNSLNSISRFILKKQSSEATEYLTKFSRLIRMILNSSASASVSLAEDLEALQLYLELESLRFEKKFRYKIKCDPEIDADFIQVPPMLLQPFVENAIWHGLMNKEGQGNLWINISQENSTLICTITDDGIGRKKAAELKKKSGKHMSMGMKITESRMAMMQKMNGENKAVKIKDLVDADGSAAGTEVVLKIPIV